MKLSRFRFCLVVGIIVSCYLAGCSKKQEVKPPVRQADKPLVEVVYDAVNFYAAGGRTFPVPPGISLTSATVVRTEGGKQVPFLEVRGQQQRGVSEAVITFRFPATWLTTEKAQIAGLETEMKELTACSTRLISQSDSQKDTGDSCEMMDISQDGRQGISIKSSTIKHIEMLILARN